MGRGSEAKFAQMWLCQSRAAAMPRNAHINVIRSFCFQLLAVMINVIPVLFEYNLMAPH